ncbi:MAG: FecCD family ABC transporter permease [Bacteroidota bacterium]
MINSFAISQYKDTFIIFSIGVALVGAVLFSLTVGAVGIPVHDVVGMILKKFGFLPAMHIDDIHETVLFNIRLPRLIMTVLIGGTLGISGASLQGLFRNPLVEPGLIGVSSGAAATIVSLIVFGGTFFEFAEESFLFQSLLPAAAFCGGLATTFLVLRMGRQQGRTNMAVLVLSGVAVNALAGAIMGLAIFYADENQLRMFTFWTLGDLGGASWQKLMISTPLLVFPCVTLLLYSRSLNAIALGEAEAYHLGVDVERTKLAIIILSALGVGVSVSLAGMIGFVGLVVPHLVRTCFHSDNTLVLPASVLGGALLLICADLVSRTVVIPAELPIGVVTAFVGSPFFIGLLMKAKTKVEF